MRGLKQLTSKPVVGVGRFTSPDTMVRMIRDGVLDFIGAARPSIADPFLPRKIEQGRLEDICECIGCNICVSGDSTMTPIRCTQNPTHGRGVAARLASGAVPAQGQRRQGADRRRRPGRARGRPRARQARLRGGAGRGQRTARRHGSPARRGCPAWRPGSGCSTTAAASWRSCPTWRSPTTAS